MTLDGQGLLVLGDPVRTSGAEAARIGRAAQAAGVRGLLIGSSFDGAAETHEVARALRANAPGIPVALFPGSAMQLTDQVDLILFLSLVSGRNPQYLIEEHVRAVPYLRQHPVPTLSTAYILIDGGRVTSVESVSQTRPLPADKPELAAAHATAATLIGMQAVYLDAGRGAGGRHRRHRGPVRGNAARRRYAVLRRQRRQRRGRPARRHRVCGALPDQSTSDARGRAHDRHLVTHGLCQRHGLR